MPTNMNPIASSSSAAASTQQEALQGLLAYCQEQSIHISPLLAAKHYPGRGLGVYAVKPIKKGDRLIHVPVNALLTTQSIPSYFLSKAEKKKLSVHCLLAAYLAFGQDNDIAKYERWMATWPGLDDFAESMPIFWSRHLRRLESTPNQTSVPDNRASKRRKTLNGVNGPSQTNTTTTVRLSSYTRSPGVDGRWLTIAQEKGGHNSTSHLSKQIDKLHDCIISVDRYFPHLKVRDPTSVAAYRKFLHMWACVNTRCFYYLRPGQPPPNDSNEAMALCPFQDLFNHSDATGCRVKFDKGGFYVRADKDYAQGEELFLNYGSHSNDMLWMEYGFTMTKNKQDHLKIDDVVLSTFDQTKRKILESSGYSGNYTLKVDGVCYRTTMTSYVGLLSNEQWRRMVNGGQLDPETNPAYQSIRLEAKRRIVDWILKVKNEAKWNLKALSSKADDDQLLQEWITGTSLSENQQNEEAQIRLARKRRRFCITRWTQIFDMCMSAIREIERECPGSFVDETKAGRHKQDLTETADCISTDPVELS